MDSSKKKSLAKHSVIILGLGGAGGDAARILARAGLGRLCLMDSAIVQESSLTGATLFSTADVGKRAADAAREKLVVANPAIEIETLTETLNAQNAERIAERYALLIDDLSDWQSKLLASDVCMQLHKPLLHSGCLGYNFQFFDMLPSKSACLRCVFQLIGLDDLPRLSKDTQPFAPSAAMAGAMLASEAIKLITGVGSLPGDEVLQYDGLKRQFYVTRGMTPRKDCPDCGRWISTTP